MSTYEYIESFHVQKMSSVLKLFPWNLFYLIWRKMTVWVLLSPCHFWLHVFSAHTPEEHDSAQESTAQRKSVQAQSECLLQGLWHCHCCTGGISIFSACFCQWLQQQGDLSSCSEQIDIPEQKGRKRTFSGGNLDTDVVSVHLWPACTQPQARVLDSPPVHPLSWL